MLYWMISLLPLTSGLDTMSRHNTLAKSDQSTDVLVMFEIWNRQLFGLSLGDIISAGVWLLA